MRHDQCCEWDEPRIGTTQVKWFMEIVDDSSRETAPENLRISVEFLQTKEWEPALALAHLAETYDFDPARLEVGTFGGVRELRSPLSDY